MAGKTTEEKILDELKKLNRKLESGLPIPEKYFTSLEDTRKILDNIWNERRPL